jgi:hypothetical protein
LYIHSAAAPRCPITMGCFYPATLTDSFTLIKGTRLQRNNLLLNALRFLLTGVSAIISFVAVCLLRYVFGAFSVGIEKHDSSIGS